jgi:hypothetical protein
MLNPERLVILDVLSHTRPRKREHLHRALHQFTAEQVDEAIANLERAAVVRVVHDTVQATDALKRLEAIRMLEAV